MKLFLSSAASVLALTLAHISTTLLSFHADSSRKQLPSHFEHPLLPSPSMCHSPFDFFTFPDNIQSWKEYIQSYDKNYRMEHPNIYDHEIITDLLFNYIEDR